MQKGVDKQKQAVEKLFVVFVGHTPSEVELFECEQSLYFLGRAVFRYLKLQKEKEAHGK